MFTYLIKDTRLNYFANIKILETANFVFLQVSESKIIDFKSTPFEGRIVMLIIPSCVEDGVFYSFNFTFQALI